MGHPSVAIIGAGLGGLCAAIKLKEAGVKNLVIVEQSDQVGGTWRDNTYPGCCCDTPVALYQFSFAPSLHWSHIFPRQKEVYAYAASIAANFELRPHLRLNQAVSSAVWNESRSRWQLETSQGERFEAQVLISALGQLNRPQLPNIRGRDSFAGAAFHSARWDHNVAAQDRFNRQLQDDLGRSTWADAHCRSWYKNARGEITQNWSSHTRDYAKATAEVNWEDYELSD